MRDDVTAIVNERPHATPMRPDDDDVPCLRVPFCTSTVHTGPRPRSSLASITVPRASRLGLALSSKSSACSWIASMSFSRPIFLVALTGTASTSPPKSSTTTSCAKSSCLTRSGLASGLSILLIATTIGTFAALAWRMASIVCGITPSSAATTSTTISVTWLRAPASR